MNDRAYHQWDMDQNLSLASLFLSLQRKDLPLPEELDASESRARHGFRGVLRPLILDIFHFRHLTSLVNILQVAIVLLISSLKCF